MQIISEPGCQVFKLVALFPIGRRLESKRGLVQSVAAMMKKSTQTKTNKTLHEFLDRYSIQIEIYSTPTHVTAQLHCHKKFIEQSIPILFEILFQARFTKSQWELVRHQTIDNIEQQMKQTDFWADKLLTEHLFGENHPYGYYSEPKDYMCIHLTEIENFYSTYIQHQNPEIFLAGDHVQVAKGFIHKEMKKYKLNNRLKKSDVNIAYPDPIMLEKRIEGSSQASVRLGKLFQRRSFEDFQKMELWTMHLGGYYMSELMKLLRVEMGLTYGVYTHLNHFPGTTILNIGFETDKKNVPLALEAISELFERFQKEKRIEISAARKEYFSQWSKNSEKSLQEIMYKVRMFKLGYDYTSYSNWVNSLEDTPNSKTILMDPAIFDFSSYSKSVVY